MAMYTVCSTHTIAFIKLSSSLKLHHVSKFVASKKKAEYSATKIMVINRAIVVNQ